MATERVSTTLPEATEAQIAASEDKKGWPERAIEVDYDFHCGKEDSPEDFYGEDVAKSLIAKSARVSLQSMVRRMLKAGKSDEDINEAVDAYKPALVSGSRKSASEKITDQFSKLSDEQKLALLRDLKQKGELPTQASAQASTQTQAPKIA